MADNRPSMFCEDFFAGQAVELGCVHVTSTNIHRFAEEFDPQPFHLETDPAKTAPFDGQIASGWHTIGLFMRLYVERILSRSASMGSPGVEQIRWSHPVRPGDILAAHYSVLETSLSRTRGDRGTLLWRGQMTNQNGGVVLTMVGKSYIGRRASTRPAARSRPATR